MSVDNISGVSSLPAFIEDSKEIVKSVKDFSAIYRDYKEGRVYDPEASHPMWQLEYAYERWNRVKAGAPLEYQHEIDLAYRDAKRLEKRPIKVLSITCTKDNHIPDRIMGVGMSIMMIACFVMVIAVVILCACAINPLLAIIPLGAFVVTSTLWPIFLGGYIECKIKNIRCEGSDIRKLENRTRRLHDISSIYSPGRLGGVRLPAFAPPVQYQVVS